MAIFRTKLERQLESENAWLREQYEFFRGKCERLELALLAKNNVVVSQPDRPPIEQTTIEGIPSVPAWKKFVEQWNALTPEQQEAKMNGGEQ